MSNSGHAEPGPPLAQRARVERQRPYPWKALFAGAVVGAVVGIHWNSSLRIEHASIRQSDTPQITMAQVRSSSFQGSARPESDQKSAREPHVSPPRETSVSSAEERQRCAEGMEFLGLNTLLSTCTQAETARTVESIHALCSNSETPTPLCRERRSAVRAAIQWEPAYEQPELVGSPRFPVGGYFQGLEEKLSIVSYEQLNDFITKQLDALPELLEKARGETEKSANLAAARFLGRLESIVEDKEILQNHGISSLKAQILASVGDQASGDPEAFRVLAPELIRAGGLARASDAAQGSGVGLLHLADLLFQSGDEEAADQARQIAGELSEKWTGD